MNSVPFDGWLRAGAMAIPILGALVRGLVVLSLLLVNDLCFRRCVHMQDRNCEEDKILLLLSSSAWGIVRFGKNLLVILVFLHLTFFAAPQVQKDQE